MKLGEFFCFLEKKFFSCIILLTVKCLDLCYSMFDMKKINLDAENLDDLYFHYTNKSNIVGIEKKGLLPKIGKNSKYIEFRRKIFFSKGEKPTLKIIDIWIKWLNSSNGIGLLYGV